MMNSKKGCGLAPDRKRIDYYDEKLFMKRKFDNEGEKTFSKIENFLSDYYKKSIPGGNFFYIRWIGSIQDNRISRYKTLKKHDYLERVLRSGAKVYEEGEVFEGAYFYPWVVMKFDDKNSSKIFINAVRSDKSAVFYSGEKTFKKAMLEIVDYEINKGALLTYMEKFLKIMSENRMYPITMFCRADKYESKDDRYLLFARRVDSI